jgi:hypothetical protein
MTLNEAQQAYKVNGKTIMYIPEEDTWVQTDGKGNRLIIEPINSKHEK